jgi:hypothetical protein
MLRNGADLTVPYKKFSLTERLSEQPDTQLFLKVEEKNAWQTEVERVYRIKSALP